MNKVKWSISLVLTFLLVGLLSTTAFASDPYNLKPVQSGLGLDVPFTGNSNDNSDVEGREFDLALKDGQATIKTYGPVSLNSSEHGTFIIPPGDLTVGKVYTIELYHRDDLTHTTVLADSLVMITDLQGDSHNSEMYKVPDSHVDVNGSGLVNSNQTGLNKTSKQKSGQNVHGFYQNNTNSCASCHQTHTGADDSLLFKEGVYSTCSACHDGTTGAYNAFAGVSFETVNSIAGTFGVHGAGQNGSLHQSDGSIDISAAPGGNHTGTGSWGNEFTCASCHAPHGSGSAAENNLSLNPLGFGGLEYVQNGTLDQQNGKLFKNLNILSSVPTIFDKPYIVVKKTVAAADLSTDKTTAGYLYSRAGVTVGQKVIQTFRWDGQKYIADYSLWLRDKGTHFAEGFAAANTVLTGAPSTLNIVWRDGFAFGSAADVDAVTKATISIGIDVETTNDVASLYDSSHPNYVYDSGTEMTKYCASCHIDYMPKAGGEVNAVNTNGHNHTELSDKLSCVRCHYSHGSEAQIMKDKDGESYYDLTKQGGEYAENPSGALGYLADTNQSSALKRYTGLASCYQCHKDGDF